MPNPSEMTTKRWEPLEFAGAWPSFNRLFDEWMRPRDSNRMIYPAVDVSEDENHLTVAAELPGLRKEDVSVTVEEGVLTISGEKKFETTQKGRNFHRVERAYGTFSRSFTLPSGVDAGKADAEFKDGVLHITFPKTEASKPKRLAIK